MKIIIGIAGTDGSSRFDSKFAAGGIPRYFSPRWMDEWLSVKGE